MYAKRNLYFNFQNVPSYIQTMGRDERGAPKEAKQFAHLVSGNGRFAGVDKRRSIVSGHMRRQEQIRQETWTGQSRVLQAGGQTLCARSSNSRRNEYGSILKDKLIGLCFSFYLS